MKDSNSVNDLIHEILTGNYTVKEKTSLIDEIRKARPPLSDRWLYRYGICFLGATILAVILLAFGLLLKGSPIKVPDGFVALASAAVGALAGLISPRNDSNGD
ncbi:hypothetical protein [Vibrio proteolyticus]